MTASSSIHKALIQEVLHRLYDESLPRILSCLDQLENEQIWWRPNESSNSIGNLVLHLCGNVTQWIYTGLGGHPDTRIRQTEFDLRRIVDRTDLKNQLISVMDQIKPVITNTLEADLLRKRPVQTFEETGLSILVHVVEHYSYHTGQIAYITKMLKDKPLDFYEGIKLD